jgi:hypothetical protein
VRLTPPPFVLLALSGLTFLGAGGDLLAGQSAEVPNWLAPHVGEGEGQIAWPVLQRARSLYLRKKKQGVVRNACYFAMDATRPNGGEEDPAGHRFYVICEDDSSFRAIPAGHGSGRKLDGVADFANGRQCARNFGNALDSELTTGGAYLTAEARTSFKGYYRRSATEDAELLRTFIQFDGEGETGNARQRAIGGHAAISLKGVCLRKDPNNPHANPEGYVPFGHRVDYVGGRSNGCTSWSASDADRLIRQTRDNPTTLYIYPEATDIGAVAGAIKAGHPPSSVGTYWNATCLKQIGTPKFWSKEKLEPVLADYRRAHPAPPPRPLPLCSER